MKLPPLTLRQASNRRADYAGRRAPFCTIKTIPRSKPFHEPGGAKAPPPVLKEDKFMAFFNSAIGVLQTLVVALGAGLGVWGAINLLEGYGNDNRATRS